MTAVAYHLPIFETIVTKLRDEDNKDMAHFQQFRPFEMIIYY